MTDRKKLSSWLPVLILAGLGISVSPHQVLTRSSEVSRALSPVLSSYEVIRMAPGEIERQVRTTGELRIRFKETDFYFNLEPHNMRAPGYRAEATGPGGVRRTLPLQPVHTFKGVLAGREDTRGRFNLTDGGVEGVVYAPEGWYYMEPLRNYLPSAPAGELVVYRHLDIKTDEALKCGVSLPERLQRGVNRVAVQAEAGTPTKYEFEIATEADYEYVQALGGPEEAKREIEGILNLVDGVYQSELLLQFRISFQHVWDMEDDPYTATNVYDLLDEFEAYWNVHYAADQDYDLANIWTGTDHDIPRGVAPWSVVCSDRSRSYGLSKYNHVGFGLLAKYRTPAHEIGHIFGALHPNEVLSRERSPSLQSCSTSIMWPGTIDGSGLTFCKLSREEISSYVSSNNGCLTPLPIDFQPPTDLEITASSFSQASFSRIDLSWQDNSANEMGYIVQRRRGGWGHWAEVDRTAANTTRFSDSGLFPGSYYMYRVQAFNGDELSAFSNEVEAETIAGSLSEADWEISTIAGTGEVKPYHFTFAERMGSYSGDGGPASEAHLNYPEDVAVDGAGNLYIADTWNQRIRRVDASGIITTIAGTGEFKKSPFFFEGGIGGYSGDGGPAVEAQLNFPRAVAVDGAGNVYFADYGNHLIRRVDTRGIITTIAGTGEGTGEERYYQGGYSGDGGPAVEARLYNPFGLAVDGGGNLYIADTWNNRIRRVDPKGTITTIAGTGGRSGYSGDGGPAVEAQLGGPFGLAVDAAGNLYIADRWNDRIRRVGTSGIITTIAGIGLGGLSRKDGPASMAVLSMPAGVAVDGSGKVYIADTWNQHIRGVDTRGIITTIAGTTNIIGATQGGYNWDSGPAFEVRLDTPTGIAVDGSGKVYFADRDNHRIRVLTRPPRPLSAPTHLKATAVSFHQINLLWRDNSNNETGFMVQRRVAGASVWTEIGPTVANVTTLMDPGLVPTTTYRYRVRAFNNTGTSAFSNEVQAKTLKALPPTLIGFTPTRGPAGTRVTLTGTHFNGSTDVQFNGVRAPEFEVVSGTSIEVIVPHGATSGPISVVAPGGTAVSAEPFTVVPPPTVTRFTPTTGPVGTRVTLTGTHFLGATDVRFNGVRAAEFEVVSGTTIEAVVPPGASSGPISVVTPGGTAVSAEPFTVVPPPTVTRFTPTTGPVGTRVTLTGTHFLGATDVRFNGVRAAEFEVVSGTTIEAVVPPGATSGPISVVTPGGTAVSTEPFTVVPPPTLTGFTPATGPAGTRVTLTGTHFLGATAVRFNGVGAVEFEVVSGRSIEAVVPSGATSGPISVVTPGGMAVSAEPFTVTTGIRSRLFVPVVLRSQGRTPGSFFTSEMTLTNRGSTTAEIHYTYRASFGVGSGTAVDSLGPGRQRIVPDAIAYLASLGVPIGEGAAGGTMVVDFSNLSSESDAAVTVRTSTPVEDGGGQAGLAYYGINQEELLTGPVVIAGLRQNRMDRSNVAVQNAGDASDGAITLRVTVYSGDPETPGSLVLPAWTLAPGGFHQYNGILTEAGFENGYVKVERVSGTAAYYAYGVINDNFNSDGSFVFPVTESSLVGTSSQTLPVIVETRDFTSELTVTNFSDRARTLDLRFVADAIETDGAATFSLTLQAGEQSILPNLVDHLRGQEVAGIGPAGRAFAGALFSRVSEGDMSGIVIGARTGSPGGGGQYGVFYNAVPDGSASTGSAWIYGLQQNATNRSNLALVNTGEVDDGDSLFSLDIYDGETGRLVKTITSKAIPARGWHQINGILGSYAPETRQGYIRIEKVSGENPFLAYGVVNDGGAPGERSGDGAYLPARE